MKPFRIHYNTNLDLRDWHYAVYLWNTGRSTYDIARFFHAHESFICAQLEKYRKQDWTAWEVQQRVA